MSDRKMGKQHIAVSAGLNIIRRACMIAFPLITYAYATRVIGAEGIGAYEFAQSVVSYFALVAALGISQYAVRDGVGYTGSDLDSFASEVFSINIIMTFISYGVMIAMILWIPLLNRYMAAILIYSVSILFTTLGVDWINSLFEDYLFLTIRYIVVSIIALISLFIFVKTPEDLNVYIAISIFAIVANGIMNFFYVRKYINLRFTFNLNLAKHGIPIFILFCNNIASVIYLNSDVTILRILTDDEKVGYYGVASKIYMMIKELMNAAIFVTIPRFSRYVSYIEQSDEAKVNYYNGLRGLFGPLVTVLVPACVGLNILSRNVIGIVAGREFVEGAGSLRILSISLFFAVMACFFAYAIIMPYKLERYFLVATSVAAAMNIILNFVLIPRIGFDAAAITTLMAEIFVFGTLFMLAERRIRVQDILSVREMASVIAGSIVVGIICLISQKLFVFEIESIEEIALTLITVVVAVLGYGIVISIFGNSVIERIRTEIGKRIKKH